ncbi:gamma-glutamylputrescine oxidase [Sinobacterium caligoides]|uniref:Gamma-glutamylputrescine oxidase n=1 Tax=Sinobacterium caligoides TaxID=933926 RepID=A0A3N2DJZ8_9GAMM|nr:FAD-binding oxidoreductase [Sinobacterium caligoides]ROS00088.1 gamma-glutamylputrescine oxidase [Sinobacterium caligoides]
MQNHYHADSYYMATANPHPNHPKLKGEHNCDVCVIGAGFTGVSAALNLAEKGFNVILLESYKVGWGATGRNGGQAGGDPRLGVDELEALVGKENAHRHWDLNYAALDDMKARIKQHNIHCGWQDGIINAIHKPSYVAEYKSYHDLLQREYGAEYIEFIEKDEMDDISSTSQYHGGLYNKRSGHLHPLNFVLGIAKAACEAGAKIFEHSEVLSYDRNTPTILKTEQGQVKAKYVVLACNGYLGKTESRLASSIMPINNFVLTTEPLGKERAEALIKNNAAIFDSRFVVNYWRLTEDHRLLFGGGENYRNRFPNDLSNFVRKYMLEVYPQLDDVKIDYAWGGTLAVTMNRMPDFGRLEPNIFYAQGYSGHGVVLAAFAGKLIAEALTGTAERFDLLANTPIKKFPGGTLLRWPGLVAGMLYYSIKDRL